jgi:hypothetical protein
MCLTSDFLFRAGDTDKLYGRQQKEGALTHIRTASLNTEHDPLQDCSFVVQPEGLFPLLPCYKPENSNSSRLRDIMGIFYTPQF